MLQERVKDTVYKIMIQICLVHTAGKLLTQEGVLKV